MALLGNPPNSFATGQVADAAAVNANFNTIYNDHNGNITDANIANTGITTYGKVSGSSLATLGNINSGAGTIPIANLPTIGGTVPIGGIIMWSGTIATIPVNWHLCDGTNSTPNLTNRFVVCADADDSGAAKSTITGSALQTSDTGVIPAHTHNAGNPQSEGYAAGGGGAHALLNNGNTYSTSSYGADTKVVAVFFALAYIQRIS